MTIAYLQLKCKKCGNKWKSMHKFENGKNSSTIFIKIIMKINICVIFLKHIFFVFVHFIDGLSMAAIRWTQTTTIVKKAYNSLVRLLFAVCKLNPYAAVCFEQIWLKTLILQSK